MLTQSSKAVQRFACRHRVARLRSSIAQAASPVICEALEGRRLLTTYFYEVPFGHSVAYIQQLTGGLPGQLQVRLDDPITGTIEPGGIFNNDEGMDIIDAGANAGFLFVDQVPAALKPISDGFDQGIQVQGGSNSRLRIEAADADTLIEVVDGSVPFVKVNDFTSVSRMGAGVSKLTIRTNNLQPMDFYPNGGTDVRVPALAGIALEVDTGSGTYDRIFLGNNDTIGEQVTVKTGAGNCIVDLQRHHQQHGGGDE